MRRSLTGRGADTRLLDVPGFAAPGALVCRPHVAAVGAAVADLVRADPPADGRLVVVGHSTGAQGALHAALHLQDDLPGLRLVLAGPTFAPTQRSLGAAAFATATAYRADSPRELVVVPQLLRARRNVLRLLRSGLADRPERLVAGLRRPLLLTAGRRDSYAPRWWLDVLAGAAVSAPSRRVVVLAGSHNNPFTHPDALADLVLEAGAEGAEGAGP